MVRRLDRINALLLQEISTLVARELKDPRLPAIISIVRVRTSVDLKNARVSVSVLGDAQEKKKALRALRSASGFLHRSLVGVLSLRTVPRLQFELDESIERSAEMLAFMDKVQANDADIRS
ncbi:MAG: 30S ribosome-binding factor RbfA [SAR202 cluster bacterium]|nr:30S ribosome-binding factor RbfA [SAR202 cluster bacterium]